MIPIFIVRLNIELAYVHYVNEEAKARRELVLKALDGPAAKSIKEIAEETNLSVRQVNGILNSLVKKGEVEVDWNEDTKVYTKGKRI
jgi:predicted transcriptional regulator